MTDDDIVVEAPPENERKVVSLTGMTLENAPPPPNMVAIEMARKLMNFVLENPKATGVLALVSEEDGYRRFSTPPNNLIEIVGMLELLQFDFIEQSRTAGAELESEEDE